MSEPSLHEHGREVRETARRIYAEERTALVARAIRAENDRDRLWGDVGALAEQVADTRRRAEAAEEMVEGVRALWMIDMRAAREAEAKVAAVESVLRALVDLPHNHGAPDCPTCQWQTRINSLLEDGRA